MKHIKTFEKYQLNESNNFKTIKINKNGFGIAELFSEDSTKDVLIKQSGLEGKYLDELGIDFNVGDVFKLKSPSKKSSNTYTVDTCRVYNIDGNTIECEFI